MGHPTRYRGTYTCMRRSSSSPRRSSVRANQSSRGSTAGVIRGSTTCVGSSHTTPSTGASASAHGAFAGSVIAFTRQLISSEPHDYRSPSRWTIHLSNTLDVSHVPQRPVSERTLALLRCVPLHHPLVLRDHLRSRQAISAIGIAKRNRPEGRQDRAHASHEGVYLAQRL